MNKASKRVLHDVDVVLVVVDATRITSEDEYVFSLLTHLKVPCLLIINKVDALRDKGSAISIDRAITAIPSF